MTTMGPVFERIVAEYREMPGLSPTVAQAGRLFGLASDQCVTVLQALVAQGRLRRREDGRYSAAGDLARVWPRLFVVPHDEPLPMGRH